MLLPPILEIFVLWHPDDIAGQVVADALLDHFHGTAFSGLVGGAVEVYTRSSAWDGRQGPPRPLPFVEQLPNGLAPAAVTVVVPVMGVNLARALQDDSEWLRYFEDMVNARRENPNVALFGLVVDPAATAPDGHLSRLLGPEQTLDRAGANNSQVLTRDLCHSVTGFVDGDGDRRLRVFISHTKRYTPAEQPDRVSELVGRVRHIIGETHMSAFFDEADLQPGVQWEAELTSAAESSALLVVRTDLYASREWCQREVLAAKQADMPVVVLQALHQGEERGCFLMDHVPSVAIQSADDADHVRTSIEEALAKLVDEALKRALWRRQRSRLSSYGFDWLPANAPEPTTLAHWLRSVEKQPTPEDKLFVLHPDPPLCSPEISAINDLLAVGMIEGALEILTPRTFANRGGQVQR